MPARQPEPGDTIGPYRVVRELARGGQGAVFEVQRGGQRLALKLLLDPEPLAQKRFLEEARVLHGLRHPHLPQVYDLGQDAARHYLVMDFVEGPSLRAHVRQRGVPSVHWSAGAVQVLAETLQYCHAQGIVHRDVKPDNAILTPAGPVLVDFGLLRRDTRSFTALTEAGEILGTPAYMAPEQAEGALGAIGPSVDVYALGATLYFLLTGQAPFRGPSLVNVLRAVLLEPAPDPRAVNPAVPPELATPCQRAMAKAPAERPRNAGELARALSPWSGRTAGVTGPTPAVRGAAPAFAAALSLVLLGVGGAGWVLLRDSAQPSPPAPAPSTDAVTTTPSPPAVSSPDSDLQRAPAGLDADADALIARAQAELAADEPEAALKTIERALALRDDLAKPHVVRAMILHSLDPASSESIQACRQALAYDPDSTTTRLVLAQCLVNRGEFSAAHEALDRLAPEAARLPGCVFVRAIVLSTEGRRQEALDHLEQARGSPTIVVPTLASDLLARLGRLDEAQVALEQATRLARGRPLPALEAQRALLTYLRGDSRRALDMLSELRAFAPEVPGIYLIRAEVLLTSARPQEALEDCDVYLARLPHNPQAHALRATALAGLGQLPAARAAALRAVELAPRAPESWYARATVATQEQDYAQAIAHCERALELHPDNPRAISSRGYARAHLGAYRESEADFTWLIERQRRPSALLHYQRGMARVGQQHFAAAVDDLRRCVELDPGMRDAQWALFQARAWAGDLPGAIADGRRLVELGFAHRHLRTHLGLLLLLQGETASAEEAFRAGAREATDAYPLLWDTLHGGDALALREFAARTSSAWDAALAQLVLGERDAASLLAQVERLEPDERAGARCQVGCYLGLLAERRQDPASARRHYRDAAAETTALLHYEHLWSSRRLEQLADD